MCNAKHNYLFYQFDFIVHFAGSYNGTVFDERKVTYDVGDSHEHLIIDGLDRAVRKFKKGEKSRLVIASKYAFGTDGSEKYSLPPDAAVEYTLELLDFTRVSMKYQKFLNNRIMNTTFVTSSDCNMDAISIGLIQSLRPLLMV